MVKLTNLNLGQKFTVMLLVVFLGGILTSGIALSRLLNYSAQAELTTKGLMLMETMNSVREYTNVQVKPELVDRLESEFLPETIPAYSAREVFESLRNNDAYGDFFYKEATLNPTNLRDQADDFETEIVESFRRDATRLEVNGFRKVAGGDLFYIARPIQIKQESCLVCHSTVEAAPQSLLDRYGPDHGFGWELNEIVGAQMISVPAAKVLGNARQSLLLILVIFVIAFAIAILLVNLWLKRYVVRPLKRMAATAEAVSMGDTAAEFTQKSNDEVGKLTESFNRMRLSLQMAMQRLDRYRGERKNSGDYSK